MCGAASSHENLSHSFFSSLFFTLDEKPPCIAPDVHWKFHVQRWEHVLMFHGQIYVSCVSCHMASTPSQAVWIPGVGGGRKQMCWGEGVGGIWAECSRPLIPPVYPLTSCTNRPLPQSTVSKRAQSAPLFLWRRHPPSRPQPSAKQSRREGGNSPPGR